MTRLRRGPTIAAAVIALIALAAPFLPLQDPLHVDDAHQVLGPSWAHWLGQDGDGRDVLSRLWWGARTSLSIAALSAALAGVFGIALGVAAVILRVPTIVRIAPAVDVMHCVPPLVFALLVVALLGPSVSTVTAAVVLVNIPGFARVVYGDAASPVPAISASSTRDMRDALSRITDALLLQFACAATSALILESSLSFLGLGVVPPALSWGSMIGGAWVSMSRMPLPLLWPCGALVLAILAFNTWRDALRDSINPRAALPLERHAAFPVASRNDEQPTGTAVLDVRNLSVAIDTPFGTVHPVRDVSFSVRAGETLTIVGESGAGKSLIGLAIFGLLPPSSRVSHGAIWLQGRNLLRLDGAAMRRLLGGPMAMVFQNTVGGLNPVQRVGTQITETLRTHWDMSRDEAREEAIALLARVGMADPERQARAFPNELSDELRRRTMIAMAIANDPRLLIADEPTASLDATDQHRLLDLLTDLRRELGMALVVTSNSIAVAAHVADRLLVMHAGEVVERGTMHEVLTAPLHPYTFALLASAPREDGNPRPGMQSSMQPPHALPRGCAFAPRCSLRISACEVRHPPLVEVSLGRATRCLRWSEFE